MIKEKKKYYLKKANQFSWGPKTARLNKKRVAILDKYVVGKKVLDIGCGTGIYVDYLSRKGKDAAGIDSVKEFINYARKNYKGKFLVADAYKLPFKDKSFDTVIMFDVLEHLEYEEKALKELQRVGKKRIIIIAPRKADKEIRDHGLIFHHYRDATHLRYYTKTKLENLAKKTGIKISEIKSIRPIPIESLFVQEIVGPLLIKKILKKIIFTFFRPANFYLDIVLIGEIKK